MLEVVAEMCDTMRRWKRYLYTTQTKPRAKRPGLLSCREVVGLRYIRIADDATAADLRHAIALLAEKHKLCTLPETRGALMADLDDLLDLLAVASD